MSQKKYTKKNDSKGSSKRGGRFAGNDTPSIRLPEPLFFWLPTPSDAQKWATYFPHADVLNEGARFVDPFHENGLAWLYAGESFSKLTVNQPNPERMSAFRLSTRRDPLVIQGLAEFIRLCGLTETWQKSHVDSWHEFHVEHFSHRVTDTPTLLSKLSVLFKVTLTSLLDAQAKEFAHQKQDFKQSCYAALIHGMKRCLHLAIKLGEPLPMETFQHKFRFAVFHGLFLYTKALHTTTRAVGQYMDPHHTLMFVIHHTLSTTNGEFAPVFHPFPDMATLERQLKGYDSLVAQGVGRKTQFNHLEPLVFLEHVGLTAHDFVFSYIPESVSPALFGELYDSVWTSDATFVWHATQSQASAVNHLGKVERLSDGRMLLSKQKANATDYTEKVD